MQTICQKVGLKMEQSQIFHELSIATKMSSHIDTVLKKDDRYFLKTSLNEMLTKEFDAILMPEGDNEILVKMKKDYLKKLNKLILKTKKELLGKIQNET